MAMTAEEFQSGWLRYIKGGNDGTSDNPTGEGLRMAEAIEMALAEMETYEPSSLFLDGAPKNWAKGYVDGYNAAKEHMIVILKSHLGMTDDND